MVPCHSELGIFPRQTGILPLDEHGRLTGQVDGYSRYARTRLVRAFVYTFLYRGYARILNQIELIDRGDVGDEKTERCLIQRIDVSIRKTQPIIAFELVFEGSKSVRGNEAGIWVRLVEGQAVIEVAGFAAYLLELELEFDPADAAGIQGYDTQMDGTFGWSL